MNIKKSTLITKTNPIKMSALYEVTGPTREYVIISLTTKFKKKYPKLEENKIKIIVEAHIPPDKIDFGSWRGWATFGLTPNIMKPLTNKIQELGEVPDEKKVQ